MTIIELPCKQFICLLYFTINSAPATQFSREKNLLFMPMSHVFGIAVSFFGCAQGTSLIVLRGGLDAEKYLKAIEEYKVGEPIAFGRAILTFRRRFTDACVSLSVLILPPPLFLRKKWGRHICVGPCYLKCL